MVRKLATLTLASLITSAAFADEIAIKPKVIHSQVEADAERFSIGGISINQNNNSSSDDSMNGLGFGVDFEFKLVDRARLGAEISHTKYEEDDVEASDMALGGFFAYDFVNQNNMSVYGKAGLSLHQFAFEDYNSASLLNGDLGAGIAFAIDPSVDIGGEYKYSTTLGKGDMSAEDSSSIKYEDLSIERNDLSVFVAFKF
jgi:opacity protein-like surface antigen